MDGRSASEDFFYYYGTGAGLSLLSPPWPPWPPRRMAIWKGKRRQIYYPITFQQQNSGLSDSYGFSLTLGKWCKRGF